MRVQRLITEPELQRYDQWLQAHPKRSLWQSLDWKRFQEALGRTVHIYAAEDGDAILASAVVVADRTSLDLSTWEIPYGPLWREDIAAEDWGQALLDQIVADARADRCIGVYVNPPQSETTFGQPSGRLVYPEASLIIDLTQSEDELLARMKPKGRYNIKVAQKHGVRVEFSDDATAFAALHDDTAKRDRFTHPRQGTYEAMLKHIPDSFLLLAYTPTDDPIPIAGLLGVIWGDRAIYYYGASNHAHRALMAPYLLQWSAFQHCKAQGCQTYTMFGVAPPGSGPDHPWSGITAFKEKFGGMMATYPPEQEIVLQPLVRFALRLKRRMLG